MITILAVLGAVLVAGTIFISTGRLHDWLRSMALHQVNQVIDGQVEIDYLSGSIVTGLTVHGLRVSTGGRPVFRAEAVELGYSLWPLVRRQFVFGELRVIRPEVWLTETDSGWNVTELMKPPAEPEEDATWQVTFREVEIENGAIDLTLVDRDPVQLRRLALDGRVALGSAGSTIHVASSHFREVASGNDVDFAGSVSIDDAGAALEDLRVRTAGLEAEGRATIADGGLGETGVRVKLTDWDPARLRPYAPEAVAHLGPLNGELTANGSTAALNTSWSVRSEAAGQTTGRVVLDVATAGWIGLEGDVRLEGIDPGALAGRSDLQGSVSAGVSVGARLNLDRFHESTGTISLRSSGLAVGGHRADRVDARIVLGGSRARVNGRVAAYGASITTVADAVLSGNGLSRVSATGLIQGVDLRNAPASLGAPRVATNVSADYRLAWDSRRWRAVLDARESTVDTIRIAPATVIAAEGTGRSVSVTTHAEVASVPASLVRLPADLASSLQGTLDAEVRIPDYTRAGDLTTIAGSAELSFIEMDPESLNPTQGVAAFAFGGGLADIYELEVKSPLAAVSAVGRVAIAAGADGGSDLALTADVSDLERLATVGITSLEGAARVEARVTGRAGAWDVKGTFAGQELAYGDRFQALTVNGEMDLLVPVDPQDVSGTVSVDGSFVVVAGNEIPKATFVARREQRRLDLRGRVEQPNRAIEFDSGIDLYPDYQEIHLRQMTIAGPGAPWQLTGGQETVIRYGQADLRIDRLTLSRDNERVEMFGRLPFSEEAAAEPSELAINLSAVNVGDLSELAMGESRVTGTANGQVRIRGFGASGTASAELVLADGRVADVPFTEMRMAGEMAEGAATVSARVTEPAGAVLDVSGRVPVSAEAGPADLHVTAKGVSLGLVQAATSAVSEVQGQASLDLRATGPLSALAVNGTARLDGGALTVAATGVRYEKIEAGVRFDEEWAYVDTASLVDRSGGVLTVTGRTGMRAVDGARQVELAVQSDGLRVLDNQLGNVEIEANLKVAGRLSAPAVTGTVVASQARLEIDEIINQFDAPPPLPAAVPEATAAAKDVSISAPPGPSDPGVATPAPAEAPPPSTGWPGATIDVALRLPDNVVIRASDLRTGAGSMGLGDLNLTLGGNLTLRKAADETPVLVGAVEVVRGFYEFQGRRFDVSRGSAVDFRGGEPSNPALNVTGEREVSGITARVQVTGTARQPVLSLSSQPALSESDVLALIVFNQPLSQLGTGEQVDLLERASDMALGAVASTLTDSIGRSLDVDLFEIRAPSAERPGEVSVGTQLSQRVFVGFRQQFGSSDASRLSIEYRLTEALRMVTSVGQGGRDDGRQTDAARLDLVYTIKY